MVIIEGPDGGGKTTLLNTLVEKYGFKVGERGTTDRKLLYTVTRQDTWRAFQHALDGGSYPQIWDRLFFSELVYADIVGRPVEFSKPEQVQIYKLFNALRCPIILCMPPAEVVYQNAQVEEQMPGVMDNLREIYTRYKRLPLPHHSITYDYTDEPITVVTDYIDNYLNHVRTIREW